MTELTRNYDVDGVVFDDYFYPYPSATPSPDGMVPSNLGAERTSSVRDHRCIFKQG